jgi:catechol 2,3-dioxygenase-like lactoylglutathione lyase family enzyme
MTTEFVHIGVTVTDIERTIEFYSKWFNFTKVAGTHFPPEFFQAAESLYQLPADVDCEMAMITSEDQKCTLELFQFSNVEAGGTPPWRKSGIHHFAFQVSDINDWYERMLASGVEFYFAPRPRGPGGAFGSWTFLKDPDGNMIELW